MPHENRDANIDLYLKSLSDYNDQYSGGKYQIRAAGQGAGYGFVNPQTDNFFDIPTQESAITAAGGRVNAPAAGSFDEYIQQIGGHRQEMSIPRIALGPVDIGRDDNQWQTRLAGATYNENPYSFGQQVPGFTPAQEFYCNQGNRLETATGYSGGPGVNRNYWNELGSSPAGGKFKQGYVGPEGGFIGWEPDLRDMYRQEQIRQLGYQG